MNTNRSFGGEKVACDQIGHINFAAKSLAESYRASDVTAISLYMYMKNIIFVYVLNFIIAIVFKSLHHQHCVLVSGLKLVRSLNMPCNAGLDICFIWISLHVHTQTHTQTQNK